MPHTPLSSASKVAKPQRPSSHDSTAENVRKRVCKACDRCRLKKAKCNDGVSPCFRCRADNAICVFGERKRSLDKAHPKGYVEMLEQQQAKLISALQEMYTRLQNASAWDGPALPESHGHPLTHDILATLGLLEKKNGELERFEDDCQQLQTNLIAAGAELVGRRGSISSDSEHSQHGNPPSLPLDMTNLARQFFFNENISYTTPASPLSRSPRPRRQQTYPPAQPSPLQQDSPLLGDPQFYQAEWAYTNIALQTTAFEPSPAYSMDFASVQQWDLTAAAAPQDYSTGPAPFSQPQNFDGKPAKFLDPAGVDLMDFDMSQFVQSMG